MKKKSNQKFMNDAIAMRKAYKKQDKETRKAIDRLLYSEWYGKF